MHTPPTRNSISPARAAAFRILSRVASTSAHSDDLLHSADVSALTPEDRNLTTTLVMGTLRWQLQMDGILRSLLQHPDSDLHPAALLALRLGLFQLLHLHRIPAHAALNESVELARVNGAPHTAGMVNAILRRVLREKPHQLASGNALAISLTPAERAHPDWLIARWRKRFGGAEARLIAEYDQAEPPRHGLFTEDSNLPEIDDGSRLIAELAAGTVSDPRRILDCCAAPGGKTFVLAVRHPHAEIVAADISQKRLANMRTRLDRNPATARVRTVLADMSTPSADPAFGMPFDLILCDAPCSGTGTLARNPEIRHRLRETDLRRQAERQRAILNTVAGLLAEGGRLVYSTCSLEVEENEDVVRDVLVAHPVLRLTAAAQLLAGTRLLKDEQRARLLSQSSPFLRTLPGTYPCDGFFAAVLER